MLDGWHKKKSEILSNPVAEMSRHLTGEAYGSCYDKPKEALATMVCLIVIKPKQK